MISVPEAEPYAGPLRDEFDPSSGIGVPAHITVLYPFVRADGLTDDILQAVATASEQTSTFEFELDRVDTFNLEVFYLAPTPAGPFESLTKLMWNRFPDHPPYGGEFESLTPHLTLGLASFGATKRSVTHGLAGCLPIRARATQVTLLVEEDDGWVSKAQFAFGR